MKRKILPKFYAYCDTPELIENYENAKAGNFKGWVCHHRLEQVFTRTELKRAGWYYARKPDELIFLPRKEHNGNAEIHISYRNRKPYTGHLISDETKEKIRQSMTGKKNSLGYKHTDEAKRKIGENNRKALKGRKLSEETKKHMSEARRGNTNVRGKHWKLVDRKRYYYD